MVASLILPSFPLPLFNNLRRLQSIAVYSYLIMKLMSERPHACPFCPKRFDRSADLKRHINVHEGHRPHVCTVCGTAFSQRSGLNVHMNKHTGEKPYVCGTSGCNRAFGDPSSCARHRRERHETAGSYRCPKERCHSMIKRRSAFIAHLKKHRIDPKWVDIDELQVDSKTPPKPADTVVIHQPTPVPAIVARQNWYHPEANIHATRPDYPQYNALMTPYAYSCTSTQLEESYPSTYNNGYTYPSSSLNFESYGTEMHPNTSLFMPTLDLESQLSPLSYSDSSPSSSGLSSPMSSPPVEFEFHSIRWSPGPFHKNADDAFPLLPVAESGYEGLYPNVGMRQYFFQ